MDIDLSVEIAGIKMKNPIMPASGTFGYGEEFSDLIDISRLGAVVTKGTTLLPRKGNEQPRVCETRAGMINFIGLQNPGAEEVIAQKIPFLRQFGVPIIVNIAGNSPEEYEQLAKKFDGVAGVSALEVNISCPNVKKGGVAFGQDRELAYEVVSRVNRATALPLIVKLTPNVTDMFFIACRILDAGADAFSLVNTFRARARIRRGPCAGKWIEGGLSGPAIMPIALKFVSDLAKSLRGSHPPEKYRVPIIGMGGISCFQDALDFLESGATAVAIGTANFLDPTIMIKIIDELGKYLAKKGYPSLAAWREKECGAHLKP